MDLQLKGKLALVTGSTAGIGLAIAKVFAGEGARVIVNGRTESRVKAAADTIQRAHPSARVEQFAANLAEAGAAANVLARYPAIDILVNNLGVYQVKPFEQTTDADWSSIIETNFMSGVRLSRGWLPGMKAAGWGRIIFISSESAVNIPAEMIHYGVTKTMQVALARGLAETTAGTGVTVNSVLAGPTRSEGVDNFVADMARSKSVSEAEIEKEFFRSIRPSSLLQRFASVDEVAAMVAFLASPLSSATNGAALRADGGVVRSIL
ncbi:MAG TPA: SDR family NAD(P)-dependent oxidoreductase [Bryobacteraceae bacterium]|jgi:NAD(P)-dependent dehydrogenase (short-subunit alcohol dehydrogenase family)|nr:SDR family NAD(P)-dependent oxidoreductase [Bryobacteraceae bacterium]